MITERNIHKIESWIKEMPSHRGRRALRGCMSIFMNDDVANTFKAIVFGASTTPITLSGAFTTGISIAADGTTAIQVTSAFTGTTGLLFAGTATDGISITGACGDAISISGTNTATAIHVSGTQVLGLKFEGTYSDSVIQIGTTGAKISLATGVPKVVIWSTSALTSGTQDIVKIDFTQTAAVSSGYIKGIRCTMTSNVKTPGSFNAIKGIIDYQTVGHAHGDCAPLAAEMTMMNSSAVRGAYYMVDLQMSCGASTSWGSAGPVCWIKFGALGTKTHLDANTYLLYLKGFTGAAGALVGANENTIKCLIGSNTLYMVMSEYEDTLSIGLTGAKKTLVTGVPEIAVWSTSALTAGTQDVVKIDFTQTAAQQTGYIKGLRCTMTSDVKTPGSFNAVKGIIDYSTNGYPWGDCAPLASELTMPNSNAPRGTFAAIEAQIGCGASSVWNSAGPAAFIRCQVNGTKTHWDSYGYFIDFQGVDEGNGKMIDSTGGDLASTGGIRCRMGASDIWLLYTTSAPA